MNKYKISFTSYPLHGKYHFSGCGATIYGDTFEDAVSKYAKEQYEEGYIIRGVVEGEMVSVIFYDLKEE